TRPPAETGGAVTWARRPLPSPNRRRQAILRPAPASTFSTATSSGPLGVGQSAMALAGGSENSTPVSAVVGCSFSSRARTGTRLAFSAAVVASLVPLWMGLILLSVEQDDSRAAPATTALRATKRLGLIEAPPAPAPDPSAGLRGRGSRVAGWPPA